MSSDKERRVRNFVSDLSTSLPDLLAPWGNIGGGFAGYPTSGNPGLPKSAREAFDNQVAKLPPHVFAGVAKEVIETMVDYVTPNFHEIVEKGEFRPINPMSKSIVLTPPYAVTDVSIKQLGYGKLDPHYGVEVAFGNAYSRRFAIPVPQPVKIADDDEVNAMLLEAKAKLKSAGMDYLTTAAEFRETLGMFLGMKENLLNRRDSAVKAWSKDLASKRKTGKFRGFNSLKEGWEAFSHFWLEYRFGWRLLAYDIQAINDYYKRKNDGIVLFTRRVTEEFSTSSNEIVEVSNFMNGFLEIRKFQENTETVRVGYSAFVDQSVLGNPVLLNTVYDILPWTLVVEMFFNVQNNILALSTMPIGVSEVPESGFVSRKMETALTILPKFVATEGLQLDERIITVQTPGINRSYARDKIGEPSFDISFKPNLDLGKIIDLATLALPIFRIIRKFLK